jgi:hypothetical protein
MKLEEVRVEWTVCQGVIEIDRDATEDGQNCSRTG